MLRWPTTTTTYLYCIVGTDIVILNDAVSWLSCYRARWSLLEEITKTEWAVCQLYPPSKRTFGACYWVAPEQKWTSLDSEVVLSAVLPCDLPQWGRQGEGRGWTIHRTGNKYPSWGKLLAVFFFLLCRKRKVAIHQLQKVGQKYCTVSRWSRKLHVQLV